LAEVVVVALLATQLMAALVVWAMWVLQAGLAAVEALMVQQATHSQELIPVPVALAALLATTLTETLLLHGQLPAQGKAHQFNWSEYEQR
jgi:hypothetical protein